MSGMTPSRLAEIRERANLQCGLDGDDADDLLIHVDHLTAENTRLRAEIAAALATSVDSKDYAELNLEILQTDLNDLLNPPAEGETDADA